jgi:LmbE family N-acetylglucosaminyl deacetylase
MKLDRILIFEPHPDDIAFQISGSVFKWIAEGHEVMICTITTGNKSTFDINVTSSEIEEIMTKEHKKAMKFFGLSQKNVVQWKYDDLGLDLGRDRRALLRDMVRLIRNFKPVTVITIDPKNRENEENVDHRLVAMTGFEAAAMAAYPNVFKDQFEEQGVDQHFVSRVLFYMSPDPDTFIDISEGLLEKKIQLGLIYDSQLELMLTEARKRLGPLNIYFPALELPKETIWANFCRVLAVATANECKKKYPKRKNIQYAEEFRLKYLGVLDKIRDFLT